MYKREAYGYLQSISKIGHCLVNLPREMWPSELRDKWYELSKSRDLLVCPADQGAGLKTIAIMEFDNFSIGEYKEQLGDLSKGLADFFEYDFSQVTGLKIVERDKLDYLLREVQLAEEGKLDQATAVKVGKMLGAQMMVFGSITQIDAKTARMVVRVVNVETSEIITTADTTNEDGKGKPNFVEMEKHARQVDRRSARHRPVARVAGADRRVGDDRHGRRDALFPRPEIHGRIRIPEGLRLFPGGLREGTIPSSKRRRRWRSTSRSWAEMVPGDKE